VCATLLNNEATRGCSILAISDFGEEKKAVKALDLGASDIITAPVDAEELMARVRTQGRRARYLDILRRRVDLGLELAVRDQLTGLNNRRFMSNQLVQWMRRVGHGGKALSVIVLDLDHFKRVNDCFGHAAGDEVLREVAGRIQLNVRPSDIPCRHGGEEFVIILPETEGDVACSIAERIRSAVAAQPFALPDGETIAVTVSLGVGTSNAIQDTPSDLLERADKALYQAEAAGRNQVQAVAA
jgi:two-component system cell cycle response regulator